MSWAGTFQAAKGLKSVLRSIAASASISRRLSLTSGAAGAARE
jgi:hypothetical protein